MFTRLAKFSYMYAEPDPRKASKGNWFTSTGVYFQKDGTSFYKRFRPLHVAIEKYDLKLYFYYSGEFKEWLLQYLIHMNDPELTNLTFFTMYSEAEIRELNEMDSKNREDEELKYIFGDHPLMGDWIKKDAYSYRLGRKKWFFVKEKPPRYELMLRGDITP